jgi:short-subunit dehydrogenase
VSRPVALVTGASSGIGLALARELAARGFDLIVVARRRERLEALAAELREAQPAAHVRAIAADLREPGAVAAIGGEVARAALPVDLLVNNAGFGWIGSFVQSEAADAQGQIAVNVAALVGLTHAFLPAMVARGRGGVINVASTAAFQPVPYMATYGATKAFVLSFTEAVHEEVRGSGVHVVALCPGATESEFFAIAGEGAAPARKRTAGDVVRTALRALDRNDAVAVDGSLNAVMVASVRLAPRATIRRVAARIMRPRTP